MDEKMSKDRGEKERERTGARVKKNKDREDREKRNGREKERLRGERKKD